MEKYRQTILSFMLAVMIAVIPLQVKAQDASDVVDENMPSMADMVVAEFKDVVSETSTVGKVIGAAVLVGAVISGPLAVAAVGIAATAGLLAGAKERMNDIKACQTEKFKEKWQSCCFSCKTVQTMISTFLKAAAKSYGIMRKAANALLLILSILWIAVFLIKNLSQFTTLELGKFMNEFGLFLFKVLVAWVCINGGVNVLLRFTIQPILAFGTEFGMKLLTLSANDVIVPFTILTEVGYA